MNHNDLFKKGYRPDGKGGFTKIVASGLQDSQSKPDARPALVKVEVNEERSPRRTRLCITRCSVQLVDFDNGCGGCKALCDALRYRDLIKDDDPETIDFEFKQKKVKTKEEEGTLIEIQNYE